MKVQVRTIAAIFAGSITLISCGFSEPSTERSFDKPGLNVNQPICQKSESTGCIEGQIVAAPDVYLAGTKYFDAEEMLTNFSGKIALTAPDGTALTLDDYEFSWLTRIDNKNFAQDFVVYLKGAVAQNSEVMRNGNFVVNRLPEGSYDLRAQRTLKFKVQRKQTVSPMSTPVVEPSTAAAPVEKKAAAPVSKILCATFYAVAPVEVRFETVTSGVLLDRFEFEVKACEAEGREGPSIYL